MNTIKVNALLITVLGLAGCEGNLLGINANYKIDGKQYNNIGGYDCPKYRRIDGNTIACLDDGKITRYVNAAPAKKFKTFEYQEWHDVQANERGEKCTYTKPQKTKFSQKFEDGLDAVVGGTLNAIFNAEDKCLTYTEWRTVDQQANAMLGVVNSIQSIRSVQGSSSSFSAPSSDSGLSSWSSTIPSSSSWNTVPTSGYKSTYGNTYQYDLSKPMDRIKYKTDPGAQLRDRITPNPYKDIETNINQQGGGIYPVDKSLKWIPVE